MNKVDYYLVSTGLPTADFATFRETFLNAHYNKLWQLHGHKLHKLMDFHFCSLHRQKTGYNFSKFLLYRYHSSPSVKMLITVNLNHPEK